MPRRMPPLASVFVGKVREAEELISNIEALRAASAISLRVLSVYQLEMVYEMAYLHIFANWETLLEESFYRYACGYAGSGGKVQVMHSGQYFRSLTHARAAIEGARHYALWHNPNHVIKRCQAHFVNGIHAKVIGSNVARIEHFASIRHWIAHNQENAKEKFDVASMALTGRRFRSSSPGALLRMRVSGSHPPRRWITEIAEELVGMGGQIN